MLSTRRMPKITICRCPKFASAKNIPNPLVVIIFISFYNTRSCQCVFILDLKTEQYMTENFTLFLFLEFSSLFFSPPPCLRQLVEGQ